MRTRRPSLFYRSASVGSGFVVPPRNPALPTRSQYVGTNLNVISYYGTNFPFADMMKSSGGWGSSDNNPFPSVSPDGYPTALNPGQHAASAVAWSNSHYPAGQYTVLWDGDGTIGFPLSKVRLVSSAPHRIVLESTDPAWQMQVSIETTNPADPVRNLRFLLPGTESTYATQPFNPIYLQLVAPFSLVRFMDWGSTNGSPLVEWVDRPLVTNATYATAKGVPIELMIDFANTLHVDPWFCIPHMASDDYVRQFATLLHTRLDPTLRPHIEYSNEMWNTGFGQTSWGNAQSVAQGLANPWGTPSIFYARRAVQVFKLMRSVYGADSQRLVRVLAGQAAWTQFLDNALGDGDTAANADVMAVAPYFDAGSIDPDNLPTADQVVDRYLANIRGQINGWMTANAALAARYNLKLKGYESGVGDVTYFYAADKQDIVTAVISEANNSPRMKDVYTEYWGQWKAAGGSTMNQFNDAGAWGKFGFWGALEYTFQDLTTSPKYQGLLAFIAANPTVPATSTVAPITPGPKVSAALLSFSLPGGAQTLNQGATATAALAPGVTGLFEFSRDGFANGTTATGNTAPYTAVSADADALVNVTASQIVFSAGLLPSADAGAMLSFSGSPTAGSVLTAQTGATLTGAIAILRADGSTAASGSGSTLTYTLQSSDLGKLPFTSTLASIVVTLPISSTAGATSASAFATVEANLYGSAVAVGDTFRSDLVPGTSARIDFAANGVLRTSSQVRDVSASYMAQAGDSGQQIRAVLSDLAFDTAGFYGAPILVSPTAPPPLYSVLVRDDERLHIKLGFLAGNNLDTSFTPSPSDFALGGYLKTAKTITAVSIDNTDPVTKYVNLTVSNPIQPSDAPTIGYSGTAIRYPGGASAATFAGLAVFSFIPPYATPMWARTGGTQSSPSAGVVHVSSDIYTGVLGFAQNSSTTAATSQDCSVQMSVLADGSTSANTRTVGLDVSPATFGTYFWEQWQLRRQGPTVSYWQTDSIYDRHYNAQQGPGYTFPTPGPLCAARLRYDPSDSLVRMETSEDGGDTWTLRQTGTLAKDNGSILNPTAWSSDPTFNVTGVATTGFSQ